MSNGNLNERSAVVPATWWMVAVVLGAIAVGGVAIWRMDRWGDRGSGLPERFDYPIEAYRAIDPALVKYHQTGEIATGMLEARAVAVGLDDRIYVAGDEAVHVFDPAGTLEAQVPLAGEPTCLAVATAEHAFPGRLYVGVGRTIEVFDAARQPAGTWQVPGEKVRLTSLAVAPSEVFAADCGQQAVLRFDLSGKLLGRIGHRDAARGIPGLVIPSPFFDVALGPDGHLWVANSGARRLEAYTLDGNLELFWGESSPEVEGFFGCCNPANFAIRADGAFVTAEKGLLRVKVYSADGQFECVVAGPEQLDSPAPAGSVTPSASQFDHEFKAVDVAVDSQGRVLILDLARRSVRVFEASEAGVEQGEGESGEER